MSDELSEQHDQLRKMMDELQPALEAFAMIFDAYEGLVSQAKQRGWTDTQARELVFRALTGGGA